MKTKKKNSSSNLAQTKKQNFNFALIAQYADYKNYKSELSLSEKTLIDLDFHKFFKYVDRTSSAVGQQFLFNKLICQTETKEKIEIQEKLANYYRSNKENKHKSQLILKKLAKSNDYYFPYLIYSELPKRMYNQTIILFLQLTIFSSIIFSFKYPVFLLFAILLIAINLGLHYLHKNRIDEKETLSIDVKHIDQITSQVLFLKTDNLQNSEFGSIFWFVFELIKILTLGEVVVFNKLVDKINQSRPQIENVYEAIGKIDVAISICSLRDGLPYCSIPIFKENKKEMEVQGLFHPLVIDCIPNDIKLINRSLLLTGSNMAGKSTFIKAINLNALCSQVLNTSFSNYYCAPVWRLKTSMTIKDNLDDKSSYYMEEVESIGKLIECSEDIENHYLFTIDEIFKGTNTIERISTAKAILEYLNRNRHTVLVSTHDIELTKLLEQGYDLYFFQESIKDESLSFDYKLKKGVLEKSNAISILELVGYPDIITDSARTLAKQLKHEKTVKTSP